MCFRQQYGLGVTGVTGAEGGNGSSLFILRHFLATIERLKGLGSIHKSKAAYL